MNAILISQQVEIRVAEANDLYLWIQEWLSKPVEPQSKLQPFEILAAVQLQQVARKLFNRLSKPKPAKGTYKLTLSAPELVAIHEIINDFPIRLYNILSQIDRKIHQYDNIVEFNYNS